MKWDVIRRYALAPCVLSLFGTTGCKVESDGPQINRKKARVEAEAAAALDVQYVGSEACAECHSHETQAVVGSRHDESLSAPSRHTVRAPFRGESLSGKQVGAVFRGERQAPTIESDKTRPVKWAIGHLPFQQYAVATERGRLQVFPMAYDARPKHEGGRRWYLNEELDVEANEPNHWLGAQGNFNSDCAGCHATNVVKGYAVDSDSYDTKLGETDVACEACHGPASRHVAIGKLPRTEWPVSARNAGFNRSLSAYRDRRWFRPAGDQSATLQGQGAAKTSAEEELESCAPCHSKRTDWGPGDDPRSEVPFSERYGLAFILSPDYSASGLAQRQVYELGSFQQSTMYQAGVICSDCHDPHSTELRETPEKLCANCHDSESYSAPQHQMHPQGTVQCIDCHMPVRAQDGIDKRRDHHFGVPRPDLATTSDAPHACQSCHKTEGAKWAAIAIKHAHGPKRESSFADALHAAELRKLSAPALLKELTSDTSKPPLVRASGLIRWGDLNGLGLEKDFESTAFRFAKSAATIQRRAAIRVSSTMQPDARLKLLLPLLKDLNRIVRLEASAALVESPVPESALPQLKKNLKELRLAARYRGDEAPGLLLLASIEELEGNVERTLELYESVATRFGRSPTLFMRWVSTLQALHRKADAVALLDSALESFPNDSILLHRKAMLLLRTETVERALPLLARAFDNASPTEQRRIGYAYAVALHEKQDWAEAIAVLRLLSERFPSGSELKHALQLYREKRDAR